MGHVYEGEEWRHTDDAPRQLPTRAEMQRSANADYATGFISLGEWRKETDRLSNVDSKGNPLKCHPLIILGNYCRCCHEAPATQIDPEVGHVCSDCQGLLVWAEGLLANAGIRPPNDSDILPPNS